MRAPAKPLYEAQRLDALRQYQVLDTLPEQTFDDLTALAANICGTPISLISLVDEHRQWFKSNVGMPMTESPRDVAFCGHTILESDLFVVNDTLADERFADNPLVTRDPHVRFYAGTPLVTPNGQAIGALCVMDRVPRVLSDAQRASLVALSRQAMGQLELRRQARELAESEGTLLEVFRSCPVAMSVQRWSDKSFVDVNPAFTRLFGWQAAEVIGHNSQDLKLIDPELASDVRLRLQSRRILRDEELQLRTRDGDIRHVLHSTELVDLRRELHAITTFVDITERHQVEIASSRLAAIVESSDDAIIGKDLRGIITSWNKSAERIFGYRSDEMIGTSILRLIPPDRQEEENHILTRISRDEIVDHFETKRLTRDGRLIDVSITASPIRNAAGDIVGISKIARDVSAERRAVEAQQASEARYRTLFDYAPDGIVIADQKSYYLDANSSICQMLGYTREELIGLHASDIVAPAEIPEITIALNAISSEADYHREWAFKRKDGSTFPADVRVTPMPDGNLLGIIRDVTERDRIEARFRRLVDSNVQGVMMSNANGKILSANDSFLDIIGYDKDDLAADRINWMALTPPEYADLDARGMVDFVSKGVIMPYEKEFIRKDGSRVSILLGVAAFEDGSGDAVCFVVDLTERKNLEQQFFRAQRMESIGTLAGGIAHDLNNVLAPIMLAVEVLRELVHDPEADEFLETLQTSARHGANLVKQVLSFARGIEGEQVVVNPKHLVNELLKVLRDTFPATVDVLFNPPRDLWTVMGDPTQLHQVLLNLCVNARDAMPNGGKLTIRLENVVLDDTYSGMNIDSRPGAYLMIAVEDTGSGIPREVQERVFEPFFTTKDIGKGTGLGLSTTMAIVRSHKGFIHLYSELGNGTKFKVYFPANTGDAATDEVAIAQSVLPRGAGELILIVDDEENIRTIARGTLERFGYRVLLARNGAEAVAVYAQHRAEIALVLTDMAMPVMDGPATIVALKSIDPAVKIIGSSGLASDADVAKAVGAGVMHFVAKPYTAEAILKALERVLHADAKPPAPDA